MKRLLTLALAAIAFAAHSQDSSLPYEKKPKRGQKVYIETDNSGDDCVYTHLSHKLKKVGYWQVVSTKDSADFIIELVMQERGANGYVVLKSKDGAVISQSRNMHSSSQPHNGFDPCRGVAGHIISWTKIE